MKGALAELLPRQEQTLLLRACVLGGESGADAWAEWSARNPDPVAGLPATTTEIGLLLPLLNHGLEAAGVRLAEGELSTALRAASLREQRRAAVLHRGVTAALEALHKSGIEVTVVGGVELAERAWPRNDLRHTHDLDLLVDECEIRRAAASLRQLGGVGPLEPSCRGDLELTHLEGAPVFLHTNPYVFRGATPPLAEVLARSERAEIGGAPAQVLARGDALVRTIGQGLCARPGGVKWVPDAWFAANAGPIDWEQLAATAGRSRLAVVVHTGLAYLVHGLGLEVPVGALERLARLAERADRAERDTVALAVMRARRRRGLRADPHALPRTGLALARRAPVYLRERLAGSRA